MFRELTRKKQALSRETCVELLKTETRGVLSVIGDGGYPYGTPMNHYYCEEDGCIYFHCGRKGHRLDALRACDRVSFCVYDEGYRREGEWALNVRSAVVFGRMEIIDDPDEVIRLVTPLCHKFTDDEDYIRRELTQSTKATLLLKLTPEHICGKLVNEA
jgi:nitroimidazol reductase NimA-like FMN-containing flavoprotein (pyridoxamine 5'-phosphate oxidase superfamily)